MSRTVRHAILIAAAAAALWLSGCASIPTAPTGLYAVGQAYHVRLGRDWSDLSHVIGGASSKVKVLTLDGPLLNRLYLTEGLVPGDSLVRRPRSDHANPPYRAHMSSSELVEFVADSVSAQGFQRVETSNLRPAAFLTAAALRFDLAAVTQQGLDMQGTAQAAEVDGKLYVLLYLAPREHYFAASLNEVERIFASVAP